MVITAVEASEKQERLDLVVRTGLVSPEVLEGLFCGVLDSVYVHRIRDGHAAVPCRFSTGDKTVGWSYITADRYAEGGVKVWRNGEDPGQQGQGGSALLTLVASGASKAGARVMLIVTSDQALLTRAPTCYLTVRVATDSTCQPEFTPPMHHVASEDCRPCRHHPRQAPPTPLAPAPVWAFRI